MNHWKPKPGIYSGIPWAQYLACPYMNPSTLKNGCRSMLRLKRAIDGETNQPSRKTTAVGTGVHCLLGDEWDERIAIMPQFELDKENLTGTGKQSTSKSTSYYKSKVAEWEKENANREILTEVEANIAQKVTRNIFAKPECKDVVENSKSEVTVIAELGGLMCKTRLDHLGDFLIADTKTTADISEFTFYRIAKKLGYFFSAGFHVLAVAAVPGGFQAQEYKFIAAEVQDDYDVGLINVPFQLLEQYQEKVLSVIELYQLAKSSGKYNGLYPFEAQLCVPNWDMNSDDDIDMQAIDLDHGTEVAF